MSTPESKVKKRVKKILDDLGAYHFSPMATGFGRSGVPDIICCVRGKFVGVECKAGTNKPTPLQHAEIDKIEAAGGRAFVIREDNLDYLETYLKEVV